MIRHIIIGVNLCQYHSRETEERISGFVVFSLIPVAVTSNRARAVDASQRGACIFQMHNLNRWHRHVFSRLLRA